MRGVRRTPACAEREVDPAVAVDVVGLDADVVLRGSPSDDVVPFPGGILVPDDGVLGHGHDVGLAVAVNVRDRDGVADIADVRVDLLALRTAAPGHCVGKSSGRSMTTTARDKDRMALS